MTQPATPVPPAGYVYRGRLFEQIFQTYEEFGGRRLLLCANLLALIPLGAGILLLWLPYQVYLWLGAPLAVFADPAWSPCLH